MQDFMSNLDPSSVAGTYMRDPNVVRYYNEVIMGAIASQITGLTIVYSTVYSNADERKHQSSASLAFVQMANNAENVSIWWRHHEE